MAEQGRTEILLARQYFPLVDSGEKVQTMRYGEEYPLGPAEFVTPPEDESAPEERRNVFVHALTTKHLGRVTLAEAQADGFDSVEDLNEALLGFYPDITPDAEITIVQFERDE